MTCSRCGQPLTNADPIAWAGIPMICQSCAAIPKREATQADLDAIPKRRGPHKRPFELPIAPRVEYLE